MADNLKLEVVSPAKLLLSDDVTAVTVPGREGNFTVMGDHAPVMSVLRPGFVHVEGGSEEWVYVGGGFAEVANEAVTILAEDARKVSDFSRAEIEEAISVAEKEAAAAESIEDTDAAQLIVDSFKNLLTEVEHMGPAVVTGA